MKKLIFIVLQAIQLLALTCHYFHCAYQTNQYASIRTIYDPEEKRNTQLMVGNYLVLSPLEALKLVSIALDPGKVLAVDNSSYYFIKLVCVSRNENHILYPADSLAMQLDGRSLILCSYSKQASGREATAYYAINKFDLIEIGDSKSVIIEIPGSNAELRKALDSQSIKNIKKFSKEIILSQEPERNPYLSSVKKKRAFLGLGRGTGYQILAAYYVNLIQDRVVADMTDFIAVGVGQSSFYYDKYKVTEVSNFLIQVYAYRFYLHRISKSNQLTAMWGLSYQRKTWPFSLELAASANCYFLKDEEWNLYIPYDTGYGVVPYFFNKMTKGKVYEGFALGIFLLAGPLWYHVDNMGVWSIGLALPIKF
jgi:hypothetical protein